MVRGPRRNDTPTTGQPVDKRTARRIERKMEKLERTTHSALRNGWVGKSIQELVEEQLTEACHQYLVLRESAGSGVRTHFLSEAQGRVRGMAMSLATMRHPKRVGDEAWWNYVKKLEKKHLAQARERDAEDE
jgi:hypothetical protein